MSPGFLVKSILNSLIPTRFLLYRNNNREKLLALTFDDGPHPVNTPILIDILSDLDVTATFFVQGSEAKKYPDLVRSLLSNGHQIGNHGYDHLDCRKVGLADYVADIEKAQKLLNEITGLNLNRLFRPPYGSVTPRSFLRLNRIGYKYIFWSADSRDSFINDPGSLFEHVMSLPIKSGDVLLFHEDYHHSVETIGSILASLKERGFSFVPISDFLIRT